METSREIFADTNYFVSLLNQEDSLHALARGIAQRLHQENIFLVISNFIFLEVVTVLSQRRNRGVAIGGGEHLLTHPRIRLIQIDEYLQQETWNIFKQTESKNVSFTDCSIIAVMQAEDIPTLLTFDKTDFTGLQKPCDFRLYEE